MAKYPVLRRLLVDGEIHEPGAVVELDDAVVDDLPDGVVGEAVAEDPKASKPKDPPKT